LNTTSEVEERRETEAVVKVHVGGEESNVTVA